MADEAVEAKFRVGADSRHDAVEHSCSKPHDFLATEVTFAEASLLDSRANAPDRRVIYAKRTSGIALSTEVLQEPLAMRLQPLRCGRYRTSLLDLRCHGHSFQFHSAGRSRSSRADTRCDIGRDAACA
jgi:hypothetical protein